MNQTKPWRTRAAGVLALSLFTTPAHAFDPWEGAEDRPAQAPAVAPKPMQLATARPITGFPDVVSRYAVPRPTAAPAPMVVAAITPPPVPAPVAIIVPPAPPAPITVAAAALPPAYVIAPDSIIAPPPSFLADTPAEAVSVAPAPVAAIPATPTPAIVAPAAPSKTAAVHIPAPKPGFIAPAPVIADATPALEPMQLADATPAATATTAPAAAIATPTVTAVTPPAASAPAIAAAPAAPMEVAALNTPAPAAVIAPLPEAPAQAPALAAVTVPDAPIVVAQAVPVAPAAPLEPAPTYASPAPLPTSDRLAIGAEIFHDNYQEDGPGVDSNALYGSLTGDYTHYFAPQWFGGAGVRLSYGQNDYSSPSGTSSNTPQWEFDGRFTLGYDERVGTDAHLKPYIGIGGRYFRDSGKGELTTLGFSGYDRKILQFYAPVGVTYEFPAYGLRFAPTIEYGPLLYGRVDSHLGSIPGYYDIENKQTSGYELRADILMSALDADGRGWAFGPFVRYWQISDSDITTSPPTPQGNRWIEPKNTRLQLGAEVKYLF